MDLLTLIIYLAVIGLILYLVVTYVPMEPKIKTILVWVVVIVVILWLLRVFGILAMFPTIPVGQ